MSVPGDIMQKGRRIVSIALLVLLWVAYSLSGLLKIYAISEFISPVLVFSVSVCLLFAARKKAWLRYGWILAAIGTSFWGLTDVFWLFCRYVWHVDPEQSILIMFLYLLPKSLYC